MYNYLMKYLFYPVQLIISDNFSCYKLLGIILKKIKINKKRRLKLRFDGLSIEYFSYYKSKLTMRITV